MPLTNKGLDGIVAAETRMSYIDGEKGILEYVGIAIDDLARNSTFEETVFLLWNGRLPRRAELDRFSSDLRARYGIPRQLLGMVLNLPKESQPMHVLRTMVSALGMFDPGPNANDLESARGKALKAVGCNVCNSTGYKGRQAIFEMMNMNSEIRELAFNLAPISQIRNAAIANGMRTLVQDGKIKVLKGTTTADEVARMAQVDGMDEVEEKK